MFIRCLMHLDRDQSWLIYLWHLGNHMDHIFEAVLCGMTKQVL